ncbi:hypothetical protein ACFL03_03350 [Thermodesulfobacteriota bacterium]
MRFKNLSELNRPESHEVSLATLPKDIMMASIALQKAFKINELVREIHKESYEWYGFTLASSENPELILDIGLPKNDLNLHDYTALGSERIAEFQESLPKDVMINGWIHSHGALNYRHFSKTDEQNHRVVLDFIGARLRKPLAKKEIAIQDMALLVKDEYADRDFGKGSVTLITDAPITEATIMETIYGSFCYCIVIGDEGWHEQEIHYRERGILSGHTTVGSKKAEIKRVDTDKSLSQSDVISLSEEVEEKIQPHTDPPPELIERM